LEKNKVDEKALDAIEKAQNTMITADAKLGAKSPSVLLRGLGECELTKDGVRIRLEKGAELSYPVSDKVNFSVPKKFDIEISAGSSVDALSKKVGEARDKLDNMCASFGITGPDRVREAFEERRTASAQIANLEQVEKENLRDLSYEDLGQRIVGLQQRITAYLPNRMTDPPICGNLDLAEVEFAKIDKVRVSSENAWETTKSVLDHAKEIFDDRKEDHIKAQALWEHRKKELAGLKKILDHERAIAPDEGISKTLNEAVNAVTKAHVDFDSASAMLKALNPEQEKELEQTARESLSRIQLCRKDAERELTVVQTRLKISGEEGLSGKLNVAKSSLERSNYEYASLAKRSAAAKLLYEIMSQERDKTRHAYVAPLKKRIEALGYLVFDDTFQVDISDDLQIINRTLQGATVDFDSLSGGTKEQLSLILRLACAMIVAEDGGAPVMLDDALGYTDPNRLLLMGAVLAKAAKECQIVIFTCVSDRYSNIGAAKEIVMAK
jgi:uncharacterized protein YhaN